MMVWVVAISGAACGVTLLLRDPVRHDEAMAGPAALGWTRGRVMAMSWLATIGLVAATLAAGAGLVGVPAAGAVAAMILMWLPPALPPLLRSAAVISYRAGLDPALLEWLRNMRLLIAAGRPLAAAVVLAAERVASRSFAPVATAIDRALATARDPLGAVAPHLAGTDAETLVETVAAAERSGAPGGRLIDRVIDIAMAALEDRRQESIESLGRVAVLVTTVMSLVFGAVITVGVMSTVRF